MAQDERGPSAAADDDERGAAGVLRAFLIADVRGYTRYTNERGDEAGAELARRFAEGSRAGVEECGGELVELRGDEALAVFTSPRQAVRAAVALQRRLRGADDPDAALPLGVGVGIDAGEAVPIEGGYRGSALNVAARLCSLAGPGEILATETLAALAGRVPGVTYSSRKPVHVKGIAQPVRLLEVVPEGGLPELPALEAPAERARGPRVAVLAAAAAALVVAAVAALLVVGGESEAAQLSANSLGRLDTGSGAVEEQLPVGEGPADVVYGDDSLWVVNQREASIQQIDPATKAVTKIPDVGSAPVAAAFGDGALWVADPVLRRLIRIDALSGKRGEEYEVGNGPSGVAFADDAAWVTNSVDGTVSRVAVDGTVETIGVGLDPVAIVAGDDAVWVANRGSDNVVRIDLADRSVESIPVGHEPSALAIGGGFVWVAAAADGTVWRIREEQAPYTAAGTVTVGGRPGALAYVDDALFVASEEAGTVARVDRSDDVTIERVGGGPTALEVAGDELWVTALAPRASHRGGTLRITGGFPITDPCCMSPGANVNPLLNDGLVGFRVASGPAGTTLVANLATAIPRPSDDGRTYRFKLRQGIRYSTGEAVKASHFRSTFERLFAIDVAGAEQFFGSLRGASICVDRPDDCDLSDAVVTDDESGEVTIVLDAPDAELLYKLAYPPAWVLPPDVPRTQVETMPLPATGPYKIAAVMPDERMTLVRNPYFKEWSRDAQPDAYPDRIVIGAPVPPEQALRAVRANRADALHGDPPPAQVEQLRVRFPTRLVSVPTNSILFAVFNTKLPPFDDERVRRAVNLAVDRDAAVASLGGPLYGRSTCQMIPPNVLGFRPYCPHTLKPGAGVWTGPDLREARRLVAASATRGDPVTVWTSRWPPFRGLADVVATALRRLGYRVDLRVIGGTTFDYYNEFGESRTAQVGLFRWRLEIPVPSDVFGPLLSCEGLNGAKFCDRSLDQRAATASTLTVTDPTAAADAWARLDQDVVARAAVVPLANLSHVEFVSQRTGNVQHHPVWGPMYGQMWVR